MLPVRKKNRLDAWDYSSAATYFLTLCTKDRKAILSETVGRGILDAPLVQLTSNGKCVEETIHFLMQQKQNIDFHKYVIMPNHVHLLVTLREERSASGGASGKPRPTAGEIPKLVSSLKRFTNRRTGLDLWQTSYYDHIIRDEDDFSRVWRYIDENPAKWLEDEYYVRP